MNVVNLEALVEQFARGVVSQWEAVRDGDSVVGNRHASDYSNAFRQLREHGDEGRRALSKLLDDPRPIVRITAAADLLRYSPAKALAILEFESHRMVPTGFIASQSLCRWKEGTWNLDPGPEHDSAKGM